PPSSAVASGTDPCCTRCCTPYRIPPYSSIEMQSFAITDTNSDFSLNPASLLLAQQALTCGKTKCRAQEPV
ncbi:MAG: hypothetical protein RR505_03670, partial [Raoultibacter sp.]